MPPVPRPLIAWAGVATRRARYLVVGLGAWGLLVSLAPAGLTREEALHALQDRRDAGARRHAVESLAETGTMEDVPALAAALRDDDPMVRALAESALWSVWSRSGDPDVDRTFAEGVAQMNGDLGRAIETFSRIIERMPAFAEAWNKRATAYYLTGQYQESLADCAEVMRRNPHHFGALSGYGLIYLRLDRPARALHYFEQALAVNPNLSDVRRMVERLRDLLRARGQEAA
jgi:tetratricopeptide (TPR) repeat protein